LQLSVRSPAWCAQVLPFVIPKLTAIPVTPANARALASVVEVASAHIQPHFNAILPALVTTMTGFNGINVAAGTEDIDVMIAGPVGVAFRDVVLGVRGPSVNGLLGELGRLSASINASSRQVACWLLGEFAEGSKSEFEPYVPMIIKDLIQRLHEEDPRVLQAAVTALDKVRGACVHTHCPAACRDVRHGDSTALCVLLRCRHALTPPLALCCRGAVSPRRMSW
jgi:hypothetical protein